MAKLWCSLTCEDWGALDCEEWAALDCCLVIGFDGAAWPEVTGCVSARVVENLYADISRINECKAVFCGMHSYCGEPFLFDASQYSAIREWVENGGRLYCNGEYYLSDFDYCMSPGTRDQINDLMDTVGSSMRFAAGQCNCGCPEGDMWLGSSGPARIMSYPSSLSGVYHACTCEVVGGTVVGYTDAEPSSENPQCNSAYPFIGIEQVVEGFVILAGDGNIFSGSGSCNPFDNCELARRFIENRSEDLV